MKTELLITGSFVGFLAIATAIIVPELIFSQTDNPQLTPPSVNTQLSVGAVAHKADIDKAIPERVYPCLSSSSKQVVLLATAKTEKFTYYLMGSFEPSSHGHERWARAIVSTDEIGCLRLNHSEDYLDVSLTKFVPEQVAREFALQLWRKEMKAFGGKSKLQQEIIDHLAPGAHSYNLFPEDIWALDQLGISIPLELLNTSP